MNWMPQQLYRQLHFLAEVAGFHSTGQTEEMRYNGLRAKEDGKRVDESRLTVEGILSGLHNATGTFRENEIVWQNQQKGGQNLGEILKRRDRKDKHSDKRWLHMWLIYWKVVRCPLYKCDIDFAMQHSMDMFQILQIVLEIGITESQGLMVEQIKLDIDWKQFHLSYLEPAF